MYIIFKNIKGECCHYTFDKENEQKPTCVTEVQLASLFICKFLLCITVFYDFQN